MRVIEILLKKSILNTCFIFSITTKCRNHHSRSTTAHRYNNTGFTSIFLYLHLHASWFYRQLSRQNLNNNSLSNNNSMKQECWLLLLYKLCNNNNKYNICIYVYLYTIDTPTSFFFIILIQSEKQWIAFCTCIPEVYADKTSWSSSNTMWMPINKLKTNYLTTYNKKLLYIDNRALWRKYSRYYTSQETMNIVFLYT